MAIFNCFLYVHQRVQCILYSCTILQFVYNLYDIASNIRKVLMPRNQVGCAQKWRGLRNPFKGYPSLSDTQKINILNMTQAIQNLCCPRDLNFDPAEMGTPLGGAVLLKLRGYMAWPIITGVSNPLPSLNPHAITDARQSWSLIWLLNITCIQ